MKHGREIEDDGEVAYGDQGLSIVVQRNLKVSVLLMRKTGLERMFFIPSALHMGGYAWLL